MEISVHSVENIPRYTADTVGRCDNLVCYLANAHMKPDSTVDTLWVLHVHETIKMLYILVTSVHWSDQDVTITYNVHHVHGVHAVLY